MATISFKGTPIHTHGDLPAVGSAAPDFELVKTDLGVVKLSALKGQRVVLNIFPSVDTPVCATSVRQFNEAASKLDNTMVVCASLDLPFAHARFCGAEGLERVVPVSGYRHPGFAEAYGLTITDGPLQGLYSRAVVVIDEEGQVVYTQQVPDIVLEPDYDAALTALG